MDSPAKAPVLKTSPFTHANVPSSAQKKSVRTKLDELGVRPLPFPFASAFAVVSDVDGSTRLRYQAYVGKLVGQLGLDFGDSTWLQWRYWAKKFINAVYATEFGFFSRHFSLGLKEHPDLFIHTRTFAENIAEYHVGNVDHFHALLPSGPRVVVIREFTVSGDRLEITFPGFAQDGRYNCKDLSLLGLCVVSKRGAAIKPSRIRVSSEGGGSTDFHHGKLFGDTSTDRQQHLFTLHGRPEEELAAPQIDLIEKIEIAFQQAEDASNVERVLLLTTFGDLLLDRVRFLRELYNVEFNLITEHAAYHFRNEPAAVGKDKQQKEHVEAYIGPTESLNGRLATDNGDIVFSTESDEAGSFARVLPELSDELGIRFISPAGNTATSVTGWDPMVLLTPSLTRSGDGIYVARRMVPNIQPPPAGKVFDGTKTRQETFVARVARILAETTKGGNLFWPLYTHLGGMAREGAEKFALDDPRFFPSPYFEEGPLLELQDRVFNISGSREFDERIWFTRASTLYEYAYIWKHVGEHIERGAANAIAISSWNDPVLNKRMPLSPSQLYGLTLYVDDPGQAKITLDGRPISTIVRNPPDETGRRSITIAESEIRFVVFEQLNPAIGSGGDVVTTGGTWKWHGHDASRSFGTLEIDTDNRATITFPLVLEPIGSQHFRFAVRTHGAAIGVVLETESGGRFFFGSAEARGESECTATYVLDDARSDEDGWVTHTIPFHQLTWGSNAPPGGPLPNHASRSITLIVKGAQGSGAEFADLAFLRPRATSLLQNGQSTFCLAGSVVPFESGQTVHAQMEGGATAVRIVAVDQRGHFCFSGLSRGIYRIWSTNNGSTLVSRRGPLIEVGTNIAMVELR